MKKFSKALVAGVLATSMMLFAGCGGNDAAQDANADAEQEAVVLTVGTNAAFEPFEMMAEDGETIIGFDVDLINAIAADQGMEVEMVNMEFDGLVMAVQNGQIDASIAGMSITPERQEQVAFSNPYYDAGLNIAVAADNTDITSEADLAGKVVASQMGTTGAAKALELQEAGVVADVKLLENINVCMLALGNGEVDAVIMDIPVNGAYVAAHPEVAKIAAEFEVEVPEQFGIAVSLDNTELLDKLNAGLENVKADAGLDIGLTLIGMHLKDVAVPLRLSVNKIGEATIVCAYTRPKFIGGSRAVY
jgi:polar amino acid transport system substrate-binding protein